MVTYSSLAHARTALNTRQVTNAESNITLANADIFSKSFTGRLIPKATVYPPPPHLSLCCYATLRNLDVPKLSL